MMIKTSNNEKKVILLKHIFLLANSVDLAKICLKIMHLLSISSTIHSSFVFASSYSSFFS